MNDTRNAGQCHDEEADEDLAGGLKTPGELLRDLEVLIHRKTRDCVIQILQDLPSQWSPGKSCQMVLSPINGVNPPVRKEILSRLTQVCDRKGWAIRLGNGLTNSSVTVYVSAVKEPAEWKD